MTAVVLNGRLDWVESISPVMARARRQVRPVMTLFLEGGSARGR
jgi:hypothetical protein